MYYTTYGICWYASWFIVFLLVVQLLIIIILQLSYVGVEGVLSILLLLCCCSTVATITI